MPLEYTTTPICDFCGAPGKPVTQSIEPSKLRDIREENPGWKFTRDGLKCRACLAKRPPAAIRHDPKPHGSF